MSRRRGGVSGSKHHRWNDRIINSDGYPMVRVGQGHPLADSYGYALEHVLVHVAAGRPAPEASQVVHHSNGDRQDSRLENLELMTKREHSALHAGRQRRGKGGRFGSIRDKETVKRILTSAVTSGKATIGQVAEALQEAL